MNRKSHVFLLLSLLLFILYLCKDKIINLVEPFGNQIIIHPDGSFNPQETTFSVLTYDKDIDSAYTQVGICSDDNSWTKGDKTCRDYSLTGSNCDDIGTDGRSALEACKVACDNCIKYEPIERRLPSPVEDTAEPSYSQFQGSGGDNIGIESDGVGTRETMDRLDKIDERLNLFTEAYDHQATSLRGLNETIDDRIPRTSLPNPVDSEWGNINGQLHHISVGKDWLWGISKNTAGDLFHCENSSVAGGKKCENRPGVTSPWLQADNMPPGDLEWRQLDVGETEVWGVATQTDGIPNEENLIYKRNVDGTLTDEWELVHGRLTHVSVGKDWIWGVNEDDDVWYCENSSTEDPDTGEINWTNRCENRARETSPFHKDGTQQLVRLDAGETEVWGVNAAGSVFKRDIDGSIRQDWIIVPSKGDSPAKFKDVSVGEGWIWAIGSLTRDNLSDEDQDLAPNDPGNRPIYKCKQPCDGEWKLAGNRDGRGALDQIDASEGEVWGVSDEGPVFRKSIGDKNFASCSVPKGPVTDTRRRPGQRESSTQMMEARKEYIEDLRSDKICETDLFDGTEGTCDERCDFIQGWWPGN